MIFVAVEDGDMHEISMSRCIDDEIRPWEKPGLLWSVQQTAWNVSPCFAERHLIIMMPF